MKFSRQEIEKMMLEIAAKGCNRNAEDLNVDMLWVEDLRLKSLYAMKICALMQMKFGVEFKVDELNQCKSIKDTVDVVEAKIK